MRSKVTAALSHGPLPGPPSIYIMEATQGRKGGLYPVVTEGETLYTLNLS